MSIFRRRPYWGGLIMGGAALALVPFAYLAGWLGDLGQVRPELSAITAARQQLAWQSAHQPKEPPQGIPTVTAAWTDASVTLSWNKIRGASDYTIYRAPASESFSQATAVASLTPKSRPSYTDTAVLPGDAYTYWVAADNAAGEGPASPALSVHTYLSWATVEHMGEQASGTVRVDQWSKTAWGLLGTQSTETRGTVWNIAGTLETPLTVSMPGSTWLKSTGLVWQVNGAHASAHKGPPGLTALETSAALPRLTAGPSTPMNLALWQQNGHWTNAVIQPGTHPVPPDALILNQYGQVVGMSTRQGIVVHG